MASLRAGTVRQYIGCVKTVSAIRGSPRLAGPLAEFTCPRMGTP